MKTPLLSPVSMGNALGGFVLILHSFFHLWTGVHPESYVFMLKLFLPGIQSVITPFDYSVHLTIFATLSKALAFWLLGFCNASLYNFFVSRRNK